MKDIDTINNFDSEGLFEIHFNKERKCIELIYTTEEKAYKAYSKNFKKVTKIINKLKIFEEKKWLLEIKDMAKVHLHYC